MGDAVDHTRGMAIADEIDPGDAFGEFQFAVAGEAIGDEGQSVLAFGVGWTIEELVQNGVDRVGRGRDRTIDGGFIGELSVQEAVVVGEEDSLLNKQGCGCCCRNSGGGGRLAWGESSRWGGCL